MQYSIVNYQKVLEANSDLRMDGEYFKPEYLSSENRIGKIKSEVLENIFDVKGGKRLPLGENFSVEGIPYIRAEDIRYFADFIQAPRITIKLHKRLKNYQTKNNDVLLTIVGNSIGDVGIVKFNLDKCNLTENCAKIINPKNILPEFLFAFLLSRYGQYQIHREKVGTAQPKLALVRIRRFKIPLLSEKTQKSIKSLVDKANTTNEESGEYYSQAEQTLLSELGLVNWKPKHYLSFVKRFSDTQNSERIDAEYFQPMYEEVVKAVKSSKNHASLGDIVSIKKCIEPGSEAYQDSGIPFLRVSNLSKFGLYSDNQQFISEVLYDNLKAHQPKKGEILLSKDATPGIAYYLKDAPGKMVPSGGILRVTVKDPDRVYPEYLTLVLNSAIAQKQIERDAGGSIINHWLVDQVKNTLIPILPALAQKKIAEKVDQSFSDREQSKRLLDIAKRGVEMAIEKSEKNAQNWIDAELKKHGVRL